MTADSPLVTPEWLAANLGQPGVVVVDTRWYLRGKRGIDEYRQGHIPTAVFADVDRDLASPPGPGRPGRHPLPSAESFAEFLVRIGVGPNDRVIAYDDTGGSTAARLWWLLRYFGHDGGRVLDGGIQAWTRAGHPLETLQSTRPRAQPMKLVPRHDMVVGKAYIEQVAGGTNALLLDARAGERYEGVIEPIDARPGHIPGAKSAPFSSNLTEPGGRFLAAEDLQDRYAALGVDAATGEKPVIAYCGSGVTACHDLLALSIIGHPDALLYEGSWSEWAGDPALPAARGQG